MIRRSIAGRPCPPYSFGHVSPIQPSAASSWANSFEKPLIHESLWRPKRATASTATSRAWRRSASCSGVHPNSTARAYGPASRAGSSRHWLTAYADDVGTRRYASAVLASILFLAACADDAPAPPSAAPVTTPAPATSAPATTAAAT